MTCCCTLPDAIAMQSNYPVPGKIIKSKAPSSFLSGSVVVAVSFVSLARVAALLLAIEETGLLCGHLGLHWVLAGAMAETAGHGLVRVW